MAPTLYMVYPSPPVRAVLITAKAIGLELELKELNLTEGEHLKPEFLKINPQHTVPTLVEEDGSVIWDSHAIMTYLVSKYGQHKESLYPKELLKRAIVDQRLHFESGIAFPRMLQIAGPILRKGKTSIEPEDVKLAHEVYAFLEKFLDGKKWVAGGHVTVADYSLISTISTLDLFVSVEEDIFPKVKTWMKKMESLGEYEANRKGLQMSKETVESKLTKK
ncbi:glutathione S-transferase 1 [Tribolium castaneum]|uniref:Glutathione S-transferase D7-like Protein n=1 Tax=Tribolium castaneum TaxID=7070 RepID=D6WFC5_TRICA|nr:PREDICTED: glutathione S-transferase 1 [Tribolium castaneum]EFA00485.1 Glutathione S-transferase D7-like Protein [Tribolium castaneum]|eukprot:XP_971203.1 PREDICTED: glutathione S-transferase 1 [Tribolium castaneum]